MLVRGESVLAPTDPRCKRTKESAESVYGMKGVSAVIRECVSVDEGCSSKGMFDGGRGGLSSLGRWCHQHRKRPLDRLGMPSVHHPLLIAIKHSHHVTTYGTRW